MEWDASLRRALNPLNPLLWRPTVQVRNREPPRHAHRPPGAKAHARVVGRRRVVRSVDLANGQPGIRPGVVTGLTLDVDQRLAGLRVYVVDDERGVGRLRWVP